jgi:tetratricopeptide (TPR) repeat protein
MADYIKFIDSGAIQLADLAYELGDFACALDAYSRALRRLDNYHGDRMYPIVLAGELSEKMQRVQMEAIPGRRILTHETWKLSKSSFVRGNQCIKSLFLDKYKRTERNPLSAQLEAVFAKGREFEEFVRADLFPGGLNVKEKLSDFFYFNSYTRYLLEQSSTEIIYEASIIEDEVLVMCDILVRSKNGMVDVYEIKLNTAINEAIRFDLAIQYTICKKRFGNRLNRFHVILKVTDEPFTYKTLDLTQELHALSNEVVQKIAELKEVLIAEEPLVFMGEQCNKPYECDFTQYCKALIQG